MWEGKLEQHTPDGKDYASRYLTSLHWHEWRTTRSYDHMKTRIDVNNNTMQQHNNVAHREDGRH